MELTPSPLRPTLQWATVADIEALVRLRVALLREVGNLNDDADEAPLVEANRRHLAEGLSSGEFAARVADSGGRVVFQRPPDNGNIGPGGVRDEHVHRPRVEGQGVGDRADAGDRRRRARYGRKAHLGARARGRASSRRIRR